MVETPSEIVGCWLKGHGLARGLRRWASPHECGGRPKASDADWWACGGPLWPRQDGHFDHARTP